MDETTKQPGEKVSSSASQSRVRHEVNLPAAIKISSSVMTKPFDIKNVTIRYVESSARGLSLIIETKATREELSKMLVRRRSCHVVCQFPGAGRASRMYGEIDHVQPHLTQDDIQVRLGVSLDESKPEVLADLRAFLKGVEEKNAFQSG
jgi:hypothetical protein